jgi:hypothetical protein
MRNNRMQLLPALFLEVTHPSSNGESHCVCVCVCIDCTYRQSAATWFVHKYVLSVQPKACAGPLYAAANVINCVTFSAYKGFAHSTLHERLDKCPPFRWLLAIFQPFRHFAMAGRFIRPNGVNQSPFGLLLTHKCCNI